MEEKLAQLREHLARIEDLEGVLRLMNWDMQTYMPPGASQTRADQMATINRIAHEMRTDEAFGRLLEELKEYGEALDYDSDEASMIRVNWREYQKLVRIPADKMEAFTSASTMAYEAWKEGRQKSDFGIFRPHLEKLLEFQLEIATLLREQEENPYDTLIAFYEPGMTSKAIEAIFSALRPQLVGLAKAISQAKQVQDNFLHNPLPHDSLLEISQVMAEKLGYSFERGRLDLTAHPFTSGNSFRDVRITTRIQDDQPISTLFSSIHEAGHAIHRQQSSPALYRTLTAQYSMGTGESQSRFYEMVIGQSREFWAYFYPKMQEMFPTLLNVDLESFYRAINKVEPGLIRVEADPVTYGLHIMLRFELEDAMINSKIRIADLPELWNAKMEEYLGVVPPNDALGVLQDVHWTDLMGYFPSYLLGSIFALQLWYKLLEEYPHCKDEMAAGNFSRITQWLGEGIHRHGGKFTLPEIARRAVGAELSFKPFIDYLGGKFGEIYGIR